MPDELRKTAQRLSLLGWKRIEEILRDKKADRSHIIAAHKLATEYGYGKPVQVLEGTGEGGAITIQLVSFDGEGNKPEGQPE